ncbi:esterase E4-like [Pseudomyrmex gracilis]|uniref:esterase E4-like n=1 Tax=Pseudomyrmex gracilis TaxID=219809 RepID=UPI0009950A1E|nr:esterase E4-like [Pseudomyrmex gracilis]
MITNKYILGMYIGSFKKACHIYKRVRLTHESQLLVGYGIRQMLKCVVREYSKQVFRIMERPIVTVKQGKLQGIIEENLLGSHYLSFKGIPFAAPPVGELRFKDPQPPASWTGIRDASKNAGDVSAQFHEYPTKRVIGGEDCLYLNVYVPHTLHGTTRNPVMVWIHGGAFHMGSGNDTEKRPDYLIAKDVILVSINYRLGALGFLNLGHEVASGNQGLKDQVAALRWIKENIEVFGGDSNNITIFGVSAGGASAHLLTLSPLAKGLFQKAIFQSGVATCDWAVREDQPESFGLASLFGKDSQDPVEVAEFLRTIPAAAIAKAQHKVSNKLTANYVSSLITFGPTIDKTAKTPFLPCAVSKLLDNGNNIPIIVGYTSHEYIMFIRDTDKKFLEAKEAEIPNYVAKVANTQDPEKIKQLTELINQRYFQTKPSSENMMPYIRFWSDLHFDIPAKSLADYRRKKNQAPTYLYRFSYVGDEITSTKLMGNKFASLGASHSDETSYLFYKPACKTDNPEPPAIGTEDRKVMEILTTLWTNFAKTGDPTSVVDRYITSKWLPATSNAFNYLEINNTPELSTVADDDITFKFQEMIEC